MFFCEAKYHCRQVISLAVRHSPLPFYGTPWASSPTASLKKPAVDKYNFATQNTTAVGNITLQRKISLPSGNITLQRKISLRQQYRSCFTGRRGRRPLRLHSITRRQSTSFDAIILLLNLPILAFPFGEGGPLAVEEVLRLSKFCNNLCLHVWNLSRLLLILADRQIQLCEAKYHCDSNITLQRKI